MKSVAGFIPPIFGPSCDGKWGGKTENWSTDGEENKIYSER